MSARVLISDKLAPEGIEILKSAPGLTVDSKPGLEASELLDIIGAYLSLIHI